MKFSGYAFGLLLRINKITALIQLFGSDLTAQSTHKGHIIALPNRGYRVNSFSYFSIKTEVPLMSTPTCFHGEIRKISILLVEKLIELGFNRNESEETEEIKTFPYLLQGQQALPNCKPIPAGRPGDARYTTPSPHPTTPFRLKKQNKTETLYLEC